MEKKIVYKIFTIADYDREAAYFKQMHSQGWKLKKVSYSPFLVAVRYTFESSGRGLSIRFSPYKEGGARILLSTV